MIFNSFLTGFLSYQTLEWHNANQENNTSIDQLVVLMQRLWGDKEKDLELDEDESLTIVLDELTLVGRLLSDWVVNKNATMSIFQRVWNPKSGLLYQALKKTPSFSCSRL